MSDVRFTPSVRNTAISLAWLWTRRCKLSTMVMEAMAAIITVNGMLVRLAPSRS